MLTASTPPPESERALVSTPIPSTSPSALDAAPGSSKGLTERSGMTFDAYPHREEHTDNSAFVRDAIIGFADGLTVPFALTAGLSRYMFPYLSTPGNFKLLTFDSSSLCKRIHFRHVLLNYPTDRNPSIGSSRLVIIGGLAELFAGAISMGLGAYLAALTDLRHYRVEEAREKREVEEMPEAEEEEIYEIFEPYGIARDICKGVVDSLIRDKEMWVKVWFVMSHIRKKQRRPRERQY